MKKILKILRNQAMNPADQNIIDTLRKEAKKERLNDSENGDFKNDPTYQMPSPPQNKPTKQNIFPQPKWIFALGCTCLIFAGILFTPQSKLRLLIPSESEKLDRQLKVFNEIKEMHSEIQVSLKAFNEKLTFESFDDLNPEWTYTFPGYQALLSLTDIKEEFLQASPLDLYQIPQNTDLEFLYQREWKLIKEKILNLNPES
jgi:hypothetical protein